MLVNLLIGTALGVLSSVFAWWIVARAITPKIAIGSDISKLPDDTGRARWRYRAKILNVQRQWLPRAPAVDLRVTATFSILGIRSSAPTTWYSIHVPVGRTGELAYVSQNISLRLRLHEIPLDQMGRLLPEGVRNDIESGEIELESLFAIGLRARLRIVVTASHSYTFGRTTAVRRFDASDIRCGAFEPSRGRVIEDQALCQSQVEMPIDKEVRRADE